MLENLYNPRRWEFSFILFLAFTILMQWQGSVLKQVAIPSGILALEFATDHQQVHFLLTYWTRHDLIMNIGLDFGYILTYTYFFISTLRFISISFVHWHQLSQFYAFMGKLFWVAFVSDIIENLCMLNTISGTENSLVLRITMYMAIIKFLVIFLSFLSILIGFFAQWYYQKRFS